VAGSLASLGCSQIASALANRGVLPGSLGKWRRLVRLLDSLAQLQRHTALRMHVPRPFDLHERILTRPLARRLERDEADLKRQRRGRAGSQNLLVAAQVTAVAHLGEIPAALGNLVTESDSMAHRDVVGVDQVLEITDEGRPPSKSVLISNS